jgi:PAS domain S-box-containing protein
MAVNTATGMLLSGLTLALLAKQNTSRTVRQLAGVLALLIAAVGTLTLAEHLFGRNLGIDQLLFRRGGDADQDPARMSPSTALCFFFAGLALFSASLRTQVRWRRPVVGALAAAILVFGGITVTAYLCDAALHVHLWNHTGVAIHTAAGFTLIGSGLLAALYSDGSSRWALDASTAAAVMVGVFCLIAIAAASNDLTYQLQDDDALVGHTHEVIKVVEAISGGVTDLESGQHGFIITGDERLLERRESGKKQVAEELAEFRRFTQDNARQTQQADELAPLIAERNAWGDRTIAARRASGFPEAQRLIATNVGIALSAEIRNVLAAMRTEEYRLLEVRQARAKSTTTKTFLLLPLGVILSLSMLFLALFFLNEGASERAHVERALRSSNEHLRSTEERFRLLISGVRDYAIFLLDEQGNVATWNTGAQQLKQWTAEEIIGQHFSRFYSAEALAEYRPQRALEIANATGRYEEQGWRVRKDGTRFWADVLITAIRDDDGRPAGYAKVTRDLTEHRRIELALKEDEARLAAVIGSAMDAVITVDEKQLITLFNPAAEKMFGYAAAEVMGTSLERLIPERFRGSHASHIRTFGDTNTSRRKMGALTPIYGLRSDGAEFPIEASISQAQVSGQKIFSVILRDVSERVAMEEARRMSETNFAMLVNQAPQFVWTCTPEGLNTFFNQRWHDYTGLTPEESRGTGWNTPFHPDDRQAAWDAWDRATATGGQYSIESRLRAAEGTYRWFLMRGEPVRDASGTVAKWLGTCTDIDAMKCAQSALMESEERFHLMANSIPQLAWMAGADGHIFWYNQRWYDYTGKTKEEMETWGWKSVHDPEVLPRVLAKWSGAIARSEPLEMEFPLRSADGQFRMFLTRVMPLKDGEGRVTRWFGTSTDISELKRSQSAQLSSQKLESLGTLSGGIAHDFNNILLAITGNTKLAIADLPPDHPVQQSLLEIAKAGARAAELVRRILTFSRPGEMKRQILDLQPVVEEALKLVRATLPATIAFRTDFAPNLPTVLADATQVHQIIVNLATNAGHAIGSRSDGTIDVRLDTAKLTADAASPSLSLPEGEYVRLYVSDNGCGMDRATLERIYDPFFTTKKPGEGTGLGLSVVHGIMKNHDGGIAVYSEPGRGTAFQLFFPAAGRASSAVPEAPREAQRNRTEKILYVDDEDALVVLIKRTLERLGYKVTGETNPAMALEIFRSDPHAFDAVVTDLAMPQLSGFDLSIQMLAVRRDVPIIMTSGYVRPEDQERALEIGLRDLILKPDATEQLARTLDQLFQQEGKTTKLRAE